MKSRVKLVVNDESEVHAQTLLELLKDADHLDCMVAFGKVSALTDLLKPLKTALARGMTARFAIGLSFHLTEPAMLRTLLTLSGEHGLSLYLSNSSATFHPKIYAFHASGRATVLVGSANLTMGGLRDNYEASVQVSDPQGTFAGEVATHFDELIEDATLVPATGKRIADYAREYTVQDAWRRMARARAAKVVHEDIQDLDVLRFQLGEMKRDDSFQGFAQQRRLRRANLVWARRHIQALAQLRDPVPRTFLPMYNQLITYFHSDGLHRQNSRVTRRAVEFVRALAHIVGRGTPAPDIAFEALHTHFVGINGAGINLLTEVLHALDNKRYAVMNQNAVTGMLVAGINGYPLHPSKVSVNGRLYAQYCQQAKSMQRALGLADLTELDALFNYVYWQQEGDQ